MGGASLREGERAVVGSRSVGRRIVRALRPGPFTEGSREDAASALLGRTQAGADGAGPGGQCRMYGARQAAVRPAGLPLPSSLKPRKSGDIGNVEQARREAMAGHPPSPQCRKLRVGMHYIHMYSLGNAPGRGGRGEDVCKYSPRHGHWRDAGWRLRGWRGMAAMRLGNAQ